MRLPSDLREAIIEAGREDLEEIIGLAEDCLPKTKVGEFKRDFFTRMTQHLEKHGIIAFKDTETIARNIVNSMGYEWEEEGEEGTDYAKEECPEGDGTLYWVPHEDKYVCDTNRDHKYSEEELDDIYNP